MRSMPANAETHSKLRVSTWQTAAKMTHMVIGMPLRVRRTSETKELLML